MYQAAQLERFGTFREMTRQGTGKHIVGDDLIPGIGLDCTDPTQVPPGDPRACIRS